MRESLTTMLAVTALAFVFWLFAESESLGDFSGLTEIRLTEAQAGVDRLIRPAEGFDPSITIDMRGTRSALNRASLQLSDGVRIEPGMPGVPTSDGRHSINLLQVLQSYEPLRATGAQIISVRPQIVDVLVTELTAQSIPIDPALEGIETVGPVRLEPERATIRLPKAAWELRRDSLRATARLKPGQAERLPTTGTVRLEVELAAPLEVASLPGFSMNEDRAILQFTVRSRFLTEKFASVPVQVVLPTVELGKWLITIDPADLFLEVEATGAIEQIERLHTTSDALIAVISLSSDELANRVSSKTPSFLVLRDGILALPADLKATSAKTNIRLTIEPIAMEAPP